MNHFYFKKKFILDIFNKNMINYRKIKFSSLYKYTRSERKLIKRKLILVCKKLIKKNIWPSTNIIIILVKYFVSVEQAKLTIKSTGLFLKNKKDWGKTIQDISFLKLLDKANEITSSILWKIITIDILSKSFISTIPGTDYKFFIYIENKVKNKLYVQKKLRKKVSYLKNQINLYNSKIEQVVKRKNIKKVSEKDFLKKYYKTLKGNAFIKKLKKQLQFIKLNPLIFYNNLIKKIKNHNIRLKFKLLKKLNKNSYYIYHINPIKKIRFLNYNTNKIKIIEIQTLENRSFQLLFKLRFKFIFECIHNNYIFWLNFNKNYELSIIMLLNQLLKKQKMLFVPQESKIIKINIIHYLSSIKHKWIFYNMPFQIEYIKLLCKFLNINKLFHCKSKMISRKSINYFGVIVDDLLDWIFNGIEFLMSDIIKYIKFMYIYKKSFFLTQSKINYLFKIIDLSKQVNNTLSKTIIKVIGWFMSDYSINMEFFILI